MAQLNPRELDVLNVLWKKSDDALTSTDIVNEQRGLTQSTVIAVLRKLLQDNLVEVAGVTHSGKVLSRTYRPTEESKNVILQNFAEQYSHFKNVVSKTQLFDAILAIEQEPEQMKKEIADIKDLLTKYEKKKK